jgi:hypothetical protein
MDEGDIGDVEAAGSVRQIPLVVLISCPVDGDGAGVKARLASSTMARTILRCSVPEEFMVSTTPSSAYSTLVVSRKRSATAQILVAGIIE